MLPKRFCFENILFITTIKLSIESHLHYLSTRPKLSCCIMDMMWPNLNVYVLSGFLLGNLQEEHLSHLNMGCITKGEALHKLCLLWQCQTNLILWFWLCFLRSFSGLVMLLQDPDPVVRVKAAEAMGHFHWHAHRSFHSYKR